MSINQSMIQQFNAFEQSLTEQLATMRKTLGLSEITVKPKKSKKSSAKSEDATSTSSEPKAPSAWNILVAQTVTDMKQNGWASWTDLKGTIWPASRSGKIKDKSGAEVDGFVYDGGEHDGKGPSPALGGMVRASYLKSQSDPSHAEKAAKYHEKLAEKRSQSGSVGSGEKDAPVADAPKKGRRKMTDAEKAEAKVKRDAKKASASAPAESEAEFEDVEAAPTPAPKPKKSLLAPKKKVDLSFYNLDYEGKSYITNDRGDLIEPEEGTWMGRIIDGKLDKSVAEPTDLEGVEMRE